MQAKSSDNYFAWCRHDVLEMIPENRREILSVGCGSGITEHELIKRGATVTGIEPDPHAASQSRANGIQVHQGRAEEMLAKMTHRRFDCIIFADVLEHMENPEDILGSALALLEQDGIVVVSVPNFRHLMVFWELFLRGEIKYKQAGILDRTHLRITTRRMVERWLTVAGIELTNLRYNFSRRSEKLAARLTLGIAKELVSRQIVVVGRKSNIRPKGAENA